MVWDDTIYIGIFYQDKSNPSLDEAEPVLQKGGPIAHRDLGLSEKQVQKPLKSRMKAG